MDWSKPFDVTDFYMAHPIITLCVVTVMLLALVFVILPPETWLSPREYDLPPRRYLSGDEADALADEANTLADLLHGLGDDDDGDNELAPDPFKGKLRPFAELAVPDDPDAEILFYIPYREGHPTVWIGLVENNNKRVMTQAGSFVEAKFMSTSMLAMPMTEVLKLVL